VSLHGVEAGSLPAIAANGLVAPGLRHAFFTRRGGVSRGIHASLNAGLGSSDDRGHVSENRRRIAAALAIAPDQLVTMHQTHSATVLAVDAPPGARPRVDALVTDRPGLALAVLHADCAPVLLADPGAGVVAAAHAGWRGATGGILEATLAEMVARGAELPRVRAAIGPTIAQPSYEVGPEFPDPVVAAWPEAARHFRPAPRAGHHLFDLPGYIAMRLAASGVGAVEDLALDTYRDERRFFSYRRATHRGEADYGRLLSAILIEG